MRSFFREYGTEEFTADFSPCTEEWQFASVQFSKSKYRTIQYIRVYCDYGYNSGTVYFDDIQLVRNSIETDLSSSDFSESSIISNTSNTSEQLLDNTPQFNEVMDIYGNVLTNTIYNDGEYGTIYRSYGFTPDCNNPENSGNDLIRETDPRGSETLYTVDEDTSRCEEIIDRCGNKIAYEYDNVGRITKICNKNNLDVELSNVSCKYDSLDTITEICRKDEMKYTFSYNPFHNLESIGIYNKPENLISCYYKNGNGRIKKITYANGDIMKVSYNSMGQIVSETWHSKDNVEIARYKYVYDSTGNIVRSIDINKKKEYNYIYENRLLTVAKEYDVVFVNDIVTAKTLVNVISYVYNKFGQVIQKTITDCDDSTFTYYYDYTDGRFVSKFFINGIPITSHSKIDKLGRKEFDELQLSTGFVSRKYSYYAGKATPEHKLAKNLKSVATTQLVSQIALSDGRAISYEYDSEERIIKVDDTIDGVVEYTYDALGQIETETKDGVTTKFKYDNYGNITAKAKGVVDENGNFVEESKISYAYDNDAWKDLLTSYNGQPIEYDAQGNPVKYLGHTLTWEKGRQLKKFDNIEYTYNANGIRTSKTVDGVTHTYTLEGTKILKETWDNNTLIPLYDNEDSVGGILYNNAPYYFLKNLQDDIIAIVDSKENVIANYAYDAWGKIISVNGENLDIANINPFRYRGYYYDTEIDMYYLQSRYYDPETGRFINADVAEYVLNTHSAISSNLFTYCYNCPVNGVDMFGFCGTTFRPVYRYTPSKNSSSNTSNKSTSSSKTFKDYSNDNWIAALMVIIPEECHKFNKKLCGCSFDLSVEFDPFPSKLKLTKSSFNASLGSSSLSVGWDGKLEAGFGLSIGRYSVSYVKGIDWTKSYLIVTIACSTKDGKHEFACSLEFSMSHLVKIAIAATVVGICVYFPIILPMVKSFISILTQPGAVTGALAAFIPVCERLCTSY